MPTRTMDATPSTIRRPALAVLLLLFASVPGRAQGASGGGGEVRVRTTTEVQAARRPEVELQRAERARLVAQIDALATRLEQDLDGAERQRLEHDLATSLSRLTELNTRVGLDVGTRIVMRRDPVATGRVARVLGEAQRRVATAARTGYIGIVLSPVDNHVRILDDGAYYVRYLEYPSIISVEPSSPAEQAGLRRGDLLMAYNDIDVRRDVPMHEVLEPGRPLQVRVRRDGREQSVRLTVAETPPHVRGRRQEFLLPGQGVRTPDPAVRGGQRGDMQVFVAPMPPRGETPERSLYRFEILKGVGGAQLTPVTEGLGAALGVKHGLLVTSVAPRTIAATAGLRDGDVILSAEGQVVESIPALSRLMQRSTSRAVTLEVRREKKTRKVRLAW